MRIGIDLGGTKIEVIALDEADRILVRERRPTPQGDYAAILECIAALVDVARMHTGPDASIGIATPGAVSARTGLIKNSNSTVLNGRELERDLALRLAQEVRIENDANCFALSEAVDGAGAAYPTIFGVILGTGVGGGIVVGRQLLHGRNRISGEWGHNPLPWMRADEAPGMTCYCGNSGCIETFLSGAGLVREYRTRASAERSAQQIASAAASGDAAARAALERYLDRLARALAAVINLLDPHAVVLGGGLSNIQQLYQDVPERLAQYVFSDGCDTPLLQARHGDSAGVRGAAWLWPKR